ncbi:hypothetical protein KM043_000055, partial [Ampulex compressa]
MPTCRYCKTPGHSMEECRKYRYRVETGQLVPYGRQNQGNGRSTPGTSVANRDAGNAGRRMMTA